VTVEQVQEIVEALASRLRRSVAVDDHTLQLVAVSPDHGDSDPARVWSVLHRRTRAEDVDYARLRGTTEPTRVPARPDLGLHARMAIPIRHDGALLGFLWLIDAEDAITADERDDAVVAAEALAVLLHQRLVVRDRDHALATHLLDLLLDAGPSERSAAAADLLRHGFVDDDAYLVGPYAELLEILRHDRQRSAGPMTSRASSRWASIAALCASTCSFVSPCATAMMFTLLSSGPPSRQ